MLKRIFSLLNRPVPAWGFALVLVVAASGTALATAVLPYFSSGTASFGPGGSIDFGSADASATIASADPGIYNVSGTNLTISAPSGGVINVNNCLTAACSGSNNQTTLVVGPSRVKAFQPILSIPSASELITTPGPVPPCYDNTLGNACNQGYHITQGSVTYSFNTACAAGALCSPGVVVNFQSPLGFLNNYTCSANNNDPAGEIAIPAYVNNSSMNLKIYNSSGTALPGSQAPVVYWTCQGS